MSDTEKNVVEELEISDITENVFSQTVWPDLDVQGSSQASKRTKSSYDADDDDDENILSQKVLPGTSRKSLKVLYSSNRKKPQADVSTSTDCALSKDDCDYIAARVAEKVCEQLRGEYRELLMAQLINLHN